MPIEVQCICGRRLRANEIYGGARAECPACGRTIRVPVAGEEAASGLGERAASWFDQDSAEAEIKEFLDPPAASHSASPPPRPPVLRRMFEALLDPRSIHWMLMLGGALAVLGLIVWLVSLGLFEDSRVLAVLMGLTTLAILGAGWAVVLKTRYRTAGRALTFLGCVIAPLNLWFYHAQGLVTLQDHLWIGGVVCCLLYVATLYVLQDPLFVYAVEGGVTLTVLLLLAEIGWIGDAAALSLCLLGLALLSLHAERVFPPAAAEFNRRRYGLPLFWCGHAQLAAALLILLGSQLRDVIALPLEAWVGYQPAGNLLTENDLLAGIIWLAGVYAYLYSDLVVRRHGIYAGLSAVCLVMAEVALLRLIPSAETELLVAAALSLTAVAVNLAPRFAAGDNHQLRRAAPSIALLLSAVPLLIGWVVHVRATSAAAAALNWDLETNWLFVIVMLVVAACNRVSAWIHRRELPKHAAAYFFLGAAALILAAAGLARTALGLMQYYQQAPLLMLIPIAYIVGARLWRGQPEERPLTWVAHTAAAIVLVHVLVGSLETIGAVVRPITGRTENLLLGLVFAEAALFYALAGIFRRHGVHAYFSAAAACGALWQWLGYYSINDTWHTMLYALLGLAALVAARSLGLEQVTLYSGASEQTTATRGRGLTAFQVGNAILSVALLSSFFRGLADLATRTDSAPTPWLKIAALALTALASAAAIGIVASPPWRRWYATAAVALAAVTFLTLAMAWLEQLSPWQKLKLLAVLVGLGLLVASHVGRFRETENEVDETVSFGLLTGSALAALPLLVAVIFHRYFGKEPSMVDELSLLTVTIVMLVTGVAWQIRATTLLGGASLALYLALVVVSLARLRQVEVGVYMVVGGLLVFGLGIALSIYRDRLLELPDRIARREGVFRIFNWR